VVAVVSTFDEDELVIAAGELQNAGHPSEDRRSGNRRRQDRHAPTHRLPEVALPATPGKARSGDRMSSRANPYHNASTASFIGILKAGSLQGGCVRDGADVHTERFAFIESYYNTLRRHSTLEDLSPNQFEALAPNQNETRPVQNSVAPQTPNRAKSGPSPHEDPPAQRSATPLFSSTPPRAWLHCMLPLPPGPDRSGGLPA